MIFFLGKKEDVLEHLNVDESIGLNDEAVKKSIESYGVNGFTKKKPISLFRRILESFKEPMILMLVFAGIIALGVNIIDGGESDFLECIGIFLAIALSVTITVIMEGKSAKAFEALNKINEDINVRVLRNGKIGQILQKDVVVGDIVFVETGNKISADGRLLESVSLHVDESSLTGESFPVEKNADAILESDKTSVADRINMLYSGCFVTGGNGKMIVTSVGDSTEFGKIAKELSSTEKSSTPLQEKLANLSKKIAVIGITVAAVVFIVQVFNFIRTGSANFNTISEAFITSIVLIVASVPEGLPTIVAVSLSINIIKMSKQNALVKKMVACETIGSINVICSDKTGTLTENRMTVTDVYTGGYFATPDKIKNIKMIENFSINSTADVSFKGGNPKFLGNPTECALLVASHRSDYSYREIRKSSDILYEYPFSSETKNMTTIAYIDGEMVVYTKGSPEKILAMCNMDESTVENIEANILKFQEEARRVIAFAHKTIKSKDDLSKLVENRIYIESDMVYDGFVAITDPVRKEVYGAVKSCKSAGIDIKMLTGDNIVTAKAIAKELKILEGNRIAVEAKDLEDISDKELSDMLLKICVIARSTPSIKMRVVNILKKKGNVVAVTGDGINDAPAIKNADVGIAMGITGTEVSKEASDIVLLDDSFATIVKAVQWGRGIYENFQRFIQFQLTVNLASVVVVLISTLLGLKAPFTALQLLWINIIMDGPPALALGVEPIRDDLMKKNPTKRNASIVTKTMLSKIIYGAFIMVAVFMIQKRFNILGATSKEMSTVLFSLFVMFQLFNSFNSRELGNTTVFKYLFSNKMMLISLLITFILQIIIIQFGGAFFKTVPLGFNMWIRIIALSSIIIVAAEIFKFVKRIIFKN